MSGITRVVTNARCRTASVRRDGNACVASLSCAYDPATPTDTGLELPSSIEVRGDATWAARRVHAPMTSLVTELDDKRAPCHAVAAAGDAPAVTQVCFGGYALDDLRWITIRGRGGTATELVITERGMREE